MSYWNILFPKIFDKKEKLDPLTIRTIDFNLIVSRPEFCKKLKKLTLHADSGLNYELDNLLKISKQRKINAKVLTAYHKKSLIGWALLSKENSNFCFYNTLDGFDASQGVLFEVYVDPEYRRRGVGTTLIRTAKKCIGKDQLFICPWDELSTNFYKKFKRYKAKEL